MPICNRHTLGKIGELIILKHLGGELSDDSYDYDKDLILPDGSTAEVKTQTRFKKVDAFTADVNRATNINKCLTVDKLFFIEFDYTDVIRLWDCVDRTYFLTKTKYGLEMACWPVQKMHLIHSFTNPILAYEMRKLSNSDLYDHNKPLKRS